MKPAHLGAFRPNMIRCQGVRVENRIHGSD